MATVRILEDATTDEHDVPSSSSKWLTCLIEIIILVLAVVFVFLVRVSWLEPAAVTSGSMENTLRVGERFLVDHRRSLSGTWERGDVVLLETSNGEWGEDTLVKRIVGLPGETVQVWRGQVYVNAKPLSETYLKEQSKPEDIAPVTLAAKEYYVLGDNRNNSGDSRDYGPVSNREIRGRVIRKLWPFSRLTKPDYNL